MLRELRTFQAVVRYGTFAAAGSAIGLSQSAVSAQIRQLETETGRTLFERTGRALRLNAAGRKLLPEALEMLSLAERIRSPGEQGPNGEWRLGAIASVQSGLLPDILAALAAQAPAVMTRVVPGVSLALYDQVDKGELDMALIVRPPFALPDELHQRVIAREPFVLIAPPQSHEQTLEALLERYPLVLYDRGSFGGRQVARFLKRRRLAPLIRVELDDIDAIAQAVAHGMGVALIPHTGMWRHHAPARVRTLSLGNRVFHRELILVSRHTPQTSPLMSIVEQALASPEGDGD